MFGKELRKTQFTCLDPDVFPVNHGSYGLPPNDVLDAYKLAMEDDLKFPDRYTKLRQKNDYVKAIQTVSEVVNADYRDLAIIPNATSGINIVYRSFPWKKGDKVLVTSVVYDSCEHVLRFMEKLHGIVVDKLEIDLNLGDASIVSKFELTLKSGEYRVAMFDFISSMPAYLFPCKQMVEICKKYGVFSVIDGAHGIGTVPVDLREIGPDFFTTNLHKWYFLPRATACIYVDKKHHEWIQPFPISHTYIQYTDENTLIEKFFFAASSNYANLRCIPAAKQFRESLGGDEAIWKYTGKLRDKVAKYSKERWGTGLLGGQTCQMINVIIPEKYAIKPEQQDQLAEMAIDYNHYFMASVHHGTPYVRFSIQVYNELEDYVAAMQVLEKLTVELKHDSTKST